jgi:putative membrane protein
MISLFRITRRRTTGFLAALALPVVLSTAGCDGYDDDYAEEGRAPTAPSEQDEQLAEDIAEEDEARAEAAEEAREWRSDDAEQAADARDEAAADREDRLTEAEVLGIARALNQGEVDHGMAAQGRFADAELQALCDMIVQDHRAALAKIDQVAQATGTAPTESEKTQELTSDVQGEIEDLRDEQGEGFEAAFLEDQKGMHERAIETIDDDLLPAATNPEIVQLLSELRASVAGHLEQLKKLEAAR